jgi:hypothetical protein
VNLSTTKIQFTTTITKDRNISELENKIDYIIQSFSQNFFKTEIKQIFFKQL